MTSSYCADKQNYSYEADRDSTPLVSVVCMTYNQEDYIRDALEGFLAQETSFSFEVIVHDDASTDATPAIVAEYANKYPSIVKPIFQSENQYSKGGGAFVNYVLPVCCGKYIATCEGDDYWCDSHKLERQVEYLESHPECPACAHNTWLLDCRNNNKHLISKLSADGMVPIELLIGPGGSYHTSSLLYRKSVRADLPEYAKARCGVGDYPFCVYLALNGGVYFLNSPMSVYRYRAKGSWSTRMHSDKLHAEETHLVLADMLREADDHSNGNYHKLFLDAIADQEFMILDIRGEWRKMLGNKYRKSFANCSVKKRVRIITSAAIPPLGKLLRSR